MKMVLQNIVSFIVLVLVQVLVLNNIHFMGYINPYIYILFILLLPVRFSRHFTLILAFVLGLIIDAFSNTYGMHAFSTVLIAFLRPFAVNLFANIEEDTNPTPSFNSFGIFAFSKYVISLVFIHHASFFLLEVFSFTAFGHTLLRIVLNTLITTVILLGICAVKRE
ncbi:MAG: rod shape-determining protein MreD [Bacteroidales bacterium]|jgi:rod shape-determining protein MreD|nr:rod shape-determining protein MreD [Bacteroidales bacterium]